jgi:hypothetical protein
MTADQTVDADEVQVASPLKTPSAAAVAGIVFSVLGIVSLLLIHLSTPVDAGQAGSWLNDSTRRTTVAIGMNLVPFAGIAFLWFIGVIRDRVGRHEDRFFATIFIGSGLLFVGMLFVATAIEGGIISGISAKSFGSSASSTLVLGRDVTAALVNTYAVRMAAVFTLTTVTIARNTKIISRWLTYAGVPVALVLLIGTGISVWVELLFPAWILALSVDILLASSRKPITRPG